MYHRSESYGSLISIFKIGPMQLEQYHKAIATLLSALKVADPGIASQASSSSQYVATAIALAAIVMESESSNSLNEPNKRTHTELEDPTIGHDMAYCTLHHHHQEFPSDCFSHPSTNAGRGLPHRHLCFLCEWSSTHREYQDKDVVGRRLLRCSKVQPF